MTHITDAHLCVTSPQWVNSSWPSDIIWLQIWVYIDSGNGLLPNGTKPLPEPTLTYHPWGSVAFTEAHWFCFLVRGRLVVDAHGREMRKEINDTFGASAGGATPAASVVDNMTDFNPKVALPSTASTPGLWEQPKHPVSRFQEYCQRMNIEFAFEVSNQKFERGWVISLAPWRYEWDFRFLDKYFSC